MLFALSNSKGKLCDCIRSMSGPAHTHKSFRQAEITHCGSRIISSDIFTCEGAVNTHRLLALTRNDMYRLARHHGWNALVEEKWRCKILSKQKGKRRKYTVKVCYEATIARSSTHIVVRDPVALTSAKGVDGIMTILGREARQKVTDGRQAWLAKFMPWSQAWITWEGCTAMS